MSETNTNTCKSCVGCKHLYSKGSGYSNYTWLETYLRCTKNKHPKLLEDGSHNEYPSDWKNETPEGDNWPLTNQSRCELYTSGSFIEMDVDCDDEHELLSEHGNDIRHLFEAITHAGRDKRYPKILAKYLIQEEAKKAINSTTDIEI